MPTFNHFLINILSKGLLLNAVGLSWLFLSACQHPSEERLSRIESSQQLSLDRLENAIDHVNSELRAELAQEVNRIDKFMREQLLPELQALSAQVSAPESTQTSNSDSISSQAAENSQGMKVLGRIEWVHFDDPNFSTQARIDSGAQTSSLHAVNIKEKTFDGELYVQFETEDQDGEKYVVLRKVIKSTTVRSTTGESNKRYVIRNRLKIGGQTHEVNINLNDRSKLRYNFLVGRNMLMGNYVVDVSQSQVTGK